MLYIKQYYYNLYENNLAHIIVCILTFCALKAPLVKKAFVMDTLLAERATPSFAGYRKAFRFLLESTESSFFSLIDFD